MDNCAGGIRRVHADHRHRGDGKFTLGCGIIAIVLLAFLVSTEPDNILPGVLAAVAFAKAAFIGFNDWREVNERVADIGGSPLLASVGWGLHAVTFGGIAGVVLAAVQVAQGLSSD